MKASKSGEAPFLPLHADFETQIRAHTLKDGFQNSEGIILSIYGHLSITDASLR